MAKRKGGGLFDNIPPNSDFDAFPSDLIQSLTKEEDGAHGSDTTKHPEAETKATEEQSAPDTRDKSPGRDAAKADSLKIASMPEPQAAAQGKPTPTPKAELTPVKAEPTPQTKVEAPAPPSPKKTPPQAASGEPEKQKAQRTASSEQVNTHTKKTPITAPAKQPAAEKGSVKTVPTADRPASKTKDAVTPTAHAAAKMPPQPPVVHGPHKRIVLPAVLALFGFIAGILFFTPWAPLWGNALVSIAQRGGISATWDKLENAGPLGASFKDLALVTPSGPVQFEALSIEAGLSPALALRLTAGGKHLTADLGWGGALTVNGEIAPAAIYPARPYAGTIALNGRLEGWSHGPIPGEGTLSVNSERLAAPGMPAAEGLALSIRFRGKEIDIHPIELAAPVKFRGSALIKVNFGALAASQFSLTGERHREDKSREKISKTGTLGSLGQALGS